MKYDKGEYSIKGVKTLKGTERMGDFNATLYRGKTKVAEVANGGETMFDWFDYKAELVEITCEDRIFKVTPEERLLYDYCKTFPKYEIDFKGKRGVEEFEVTPDMFIGDMINDIITDKKVKAELRKYYVCLIGDNDIKWYSKDQEKKITVENIKNYLVKQYGEGNFILLNTQPFEVVKKYLVEGY